jgi:hypothetical protein
MKTILKYTFMMVFNLNSCKNKKPKQNYPQSTLKINSNFLILLKVLKFPKKLILLRLIGLGLSCWRIRYENYNFFKFQKLKQSL